MTVKEEISNVKTRRLRKYTRSANNTVVQKLPYWLKIAHAILG
jgi:hypothetical protein